MRAAEPRERRVHAPGDPTRRDDGLAPELLRNSDRRPAGLVPADPVQRPGRDHRRSESATATTTPGWDDARHGRLRAPEAGRHPARSARATRLERERGQGRRDLRERLLAAGHLRGRRARPTSTATRPAPTTRAAAAGAPGRSSSGIAAVGAAHGRLAGPGRDQLLARLVEQARTRPPPTAARSPIRARAGTRATSTPTASRNRATRSSRPASTTPSSRSPRAARGSTGSASSTTTTTSAAARSASTSRPTRASW